MYIYMLDTLLDPYMTQQGQALVKMLITGLVMFGIHSWSLDYYYALPIIVILVLQCGKHASHLAYGHLSLMNFVMGLQWGLLPCLLFYALSMIPYIYMEGVEKINVMMYTILLVLEGLFFFMATRIKTKEIPLVAMLYCSYLHGGPYLWLKGEELLLMETVIPMTVVGLLYILAAK